MAVVTATTSASPARVFAVLRNGWYYSNWVVGTSHMRAVGSAWPQAGSKLHHASGAWPLVTRDETVVEEMIEDERLVLLARGRPFGEARIVIELEPCATGTSITLTETPVTGPGKWFNSPVSEAVLVRRNIEALARLMTIVEERTVPAD